MVINGVRKGNAMDSFFTQKELFAKIGLHSQDLFFYSVTDSTNTRARVHFIARAPTTPCLFVADTQTAGRGTRGRSFESEIGGLYFSLLIPNESLDTTHLTVMAAGATYLALRYFLGRKSKNLFIKWVNDLYIGKKKISGILSEKINGENGQAFIVGIGINLYGSPFSPEVEKIASSVEAATGEKICRETLLLKICENLLSLKSPRGYKRLGRAYRRHSLKKGAEISVTDSTGIIREARVLGLNKDFSLKVRYFDGETASLVSGDLSIKI